MAPFDEAPAPMTIRGKPLHCVICGQDRFLRKEAQLNTAVSSFFGFDWSNPSGTCFICHNCGYIHWFLLPTWPDAGKQNQP
jgi:hypothetical protein